MAGDRSPDLGGLATSLATTGLWLLRLSSAWATPEVLGKLTAPVATLPADQQELFRARLVDLPDDIQVLPLRQIAWPMALIRYRHRIEGRPLSAAMAEALTTAQTLDAAIAVSSHDVGPNLKTAAEHDHVAFHIV
jgi:hypothetical protein